ncbi:MAG: hypothetical protein U1F10_07810 [Burkholderiales bacterium]
MPGYSLTLAFRGRAVEDLEELLEVEDALYEMLAGSEEMDGHELTPQARIVYVLTDDADATFRRLQPFLRNAHLLDHLTASAEPVDGGDTVALWPLPGGAPGA